MDAIAVSGQPCGVALATTGYASVIHEGLLAGLAWPTNGKHMIPKIDKTWDKPSIAAYLKAYKRTQEHLPVDIRDEISDAIVNTLSELCLHMSSIRYLLDNDALPASFYRIDWGAFKATQGGLPAPLSTPGAATGDAAADPVSKRRSKSKLVGMSFGHLVKGTAGENDSVLPVKKRQQAANRHRNNPVPDNVVHGATTQIPVLSSNLGTGSQPLGSAYQTLAAMPDDNGEDLFPFEGVSIPQSIVQGGHALPDAFNNDAALWNFDAPLFNFDDGSYGNAAVPRFDASSQTGPAQEIQPNFFDDLAQDNSCFFGFDTPAVSGAEGDLLPPGIFDQPFNCSDALGQTGNFDVSGRLDEASVGQNVSLFENGIFNEDNTFTEFISEPMQCVPKTIEASEAMERTTATTKHTSCDHFFSILKNPELGPQFRANLEPTEMLQLSRHPEVFENVCDRKYKQYLKMPMICESLVAKHRPYFNKAVVIHFLELRRQPVQLPPQDVRRIKCCLVPAFADDEKAFEAEISAFVDRFLRDLDHLFDLLKAVCKAETRLPRLMELLEDRGDPLFNTTRDDETDKLGMLLCLEEMLRIAENTPVKRASENGTSGPAQKRVRRG